MQRRDSDDRPGGEARSPWAELPARPQVNQHGSNREKRRHDGEERAADQLLTDRQGRQPFILPDVNRRCALLAAEQFREQRPGDRQCLLRLRAHVRQRALGFTGDPPAGPADPAGQPDEQRCQRQRQHGQLPRQHDQRDHGADQGHGVRQDRAGRVGDDGLQAADVILQPALDVAGPGGGEEAQRQGLQVSVEPRPQIAEHPLPHRGGQVALPDAHQRADHRGRDHQRQQHVQQVKPGAARGEQRPVEDHLEQQRGDHSQAAGHHDETGDFPQFPPVRADSPPIRRSSWRSRSADSTPALASDRLAPAPPPRGPPPPENVTRPVRP